MAVLTWDGTGERFYETGTDRGVLYRLNATTGLYDTGEAWNGLTAVTESPSGAEATPQYADNIKYLNLQSAEDYSGTIEAFTYPDSFAECDGTATPKAGVTVGQQPRKQFGFSWRTIVGNDTELNDHGYKIHVVWGALAAPSERAYTTVNDSPEAMTFSWEFTTTPVSWTGGRPTATLTFDSRTLAPADLAAIEAKLYGDVAEEATLPTPDELLALIVTP